MNKGVFVLGTDTDVGKTFVTAGINYILRKNNFNAISLKPVQSGGIVKDNKLISGDIEFIKKIAEVKEDYEIMNCYCFKEAVSPHLASEIENVCIDKNRIINHYKKLYEKYDFCIVEGAGGSIVPLIRDEYYIYDLVKDLNIPVVIVTTIGVGTINQTVLTVSFLKSLGIQIRGLIINKYTGTYYEDDNIEVIKSITGLDIIAVINKLDLDGKEGFISKARKEFDKNLHIDKLLNLVIRKDGGDYSE
ncbi:dethiobiotin synthase [Tepidibacter hydrothermalis]|uniref:ATP-dependent dethiobiotin synthetase BioD n=1 Tax=Tepidibacter hydrothermalis TaxID=3036126 RepID=A0ABY8EE70_9FIRM|nr:dethiobiotin synthase [Tepidibacter hydrothermalis]WFD11071.1 dethiobiotin synthase [Tepidibacter hydrothermalis]